MEYIIKGQKPEAFFRHFEEISAIPRGSGNEEAISAFLLRFAEENGLTAWRDAVYNVVIVKPASTGYENAPSVMLQGHTDMVCEKNAATAHDFLKEGIHLVQDGNILRADGTTLGADNGVAVAMMMTILEDKTLAHPALYCVFTVQEETGLVGAKELDGSKIPARLLINLDSEGLGCGTVSCAGGMCVHMRRACHSVPCALSALAVRVRGLQGGHSGTEIGLGRGNANKLMGRILYGLSQAVPGMGLSSVEGGSKDNAIPRECDAVCLFSTEEDQQKAVSLIREMEAEIAQELREADPGFAVLTEQTSAQTKMADEDAQALIGLLMLAPNGVRDRNENAGGFIVRSLNLGVIRMEDDAVTVVFAPRSSVASLQEQMEAELCLLAKTLGFEAETHDAYPGWAYNPESPLRRLFSEVWKEQSGKEFVTEAIHAGLECGLFSDKLPGLDAIAVGAGCTGCHTPDEAMDMTTIEPLYQLVKGVLERIH